jgi:hypothetical protein
MPLRAMTSFARTIVAVTALMMAVAGCAASRPVPTAVAAPTWPDDWGIQFALRCTAAGNDARFCTCLANEVQKRWTPEQFKALEPDGLQDEGRVCRDRLRDGDGR